MSNIIAITNNTKRIRFDLTNENVLKYKITISDITNVSDNYVNIKFFINTDNTDGSGNILIDSFLNDEKIRSEIYNFKFTDIFVDKLIKLNTDTITIGINYDVLNGIGVNYGEIVGSITQLNLPLVSRIYGSEDVPIKTLDGKLLINLESQPIDISGQTVVVSGEIDISGQRVDISGQHVITDISGQRVDVSILGRDPETNVLNNPTVDNNLKALSVCEKNFGKSFTVAYGNITSTGSFLILTSDNVTFDTNTIYFNETGLIPNVGAARSMSIVANTAITSKIRCYGIDLSGYEKIFYVTLNGTIPVTSGNTKLDGTGNNVNLTTELRHINWIEDIVVRSSGIIKVTCTINSKSVTLIQLAHYYIINPIYLCPKGRKTLIKGLTYISTDATNQYGWIVYKPNDDNTHSVKFPYRLTIISTATNNNSYQWSDTGLVTLEECEWCFLNRESDTAQTTCTINVLFTELKA